MMNVNWLKILIGAIFEVGWVVGLKHSYNVWTWIGTGIAIYLSFYFLIKASEQLPVGTAYAVFVGLGTAGTVLIEMVLFNEPVKIIKIMLIGVLLIGIIGLKLVTPNEKSEGGTT